MTSRYFRNFPLVFYFTKTCTDFSFILITFHCKRVHYQIFFNSIPDFSPNKFYIFLAIHHFFIKKYMYLVSSKSLLYALIFGSIIHNSLIFLLSLYSIIHITLFTERNFVRYQDFINIYIMFVIIYIYIIYISIYVGEIWVFQFLFHQTLTIFICDIQKIFFIILLFFGQVSILLHIYGFTYANSVDTAAIIHAVYI